jgi:hypothetical protein
MYLFVNSLEGNFGATNYENKVCFFYRRLEHRRHYGMSGGCPISIP